MLNACPVAALIPKLLIQIRRCSTVNTLVCSFLFLLVCFYSKGTVRECDLGGFSERLYLVAVELTKSNIYSNLGV